MSKLIKKLKRNLKWRVKNESCDEEIMFYYTDGTHGGWSNFWRWKDITQHLRYKRIIWEFNPPLLEDDAINYIRNTPPNTKQDGHTSVSTGGHDDIGGIKEGASDRNDGDGDTFGGGGFKDDGLGNPYAPKDPPGKDTGKDGKGGS